MRRAQPIVEPAKRRRSERLLRTTYLMRAAAAAVVLAGSVTLFNAFGPENLDPQVGVSKLGASAASATIDDRLHIEIQVLRGSEVLAQGNLKSIEGAQMAANLGSGYKTTFKTDQLGTNGSVTLRDFEMEKVSLVKSRRAPIQFHYSELELAPENPLTLTLAPSDPDGEALVLIITWRASTLP